MEHHVYFWLKDEKSGESDCAKFESGLAALLEIKSVAGGAWGKPAATPVRPVSVNTWHYGLSLRFDSIADHDAYQVDAAHDVFVDQFKDYWEKVMVMDMEQSN